MVTVFKKNFNLIRTAIYSNTSKGDTHELRPLLPNQLEMREEENVKIIPKLKNTVKFTRVLRGHRFKIQISNAYALKDIQCYLTLHFFLSNSDIYLMTFDSIVYYYFVFL